MTTGASGHCTARGRNASQWTWPLTTALANCPFSLNVSHGRSLAGMIELSGNRSKPFSHPF
jgi:hypothetical protein